MKLLLIMAFIMTNALAQEKQDGQEKKYTQVEFDEKLKEMVGKEVESNLKKIAPQNIVQFSKDLLKKEEELEKFEKDLKRREETLEISKKKFMSDLGGFKKKQETVLGCIEDNKNDSNERINHIVKVISNMKPANAAKVLSKQDPDISVKILGILDAVKAAKIFNQMDQEVSARLQKQYMNMKR